MIEELRGISCLSLEVVEPRKQIMSSRSFGKLISDIESIEEALSHYVASACVKLRKQKSRASGIYVFLYTNPFRLNEKQYANTITISFTPV